MIYYFDMDMYTLHTYGTSVLFHLHFHWYNARKATTNAIKQSKRKYIDANALHIYSLPNNGMKIPRFCVIQTNSQQISYAFV